VGEFVRVIPPRNPSRGGLAREEFALARASLVHFNDTRCGSVAGLRSVIARARRLGRDDAERERAAAAVKTWLLAQIEKKP
jgi:hypothetical protein